MGILGKAARFYAVATEMQSINRKGGYVLGRMAAVGVG